MSVIVEPNQLLYKMYYYDVCYHNSKMVQKRKVGNPDDFKSLFSISKFCCVLHDLIITTKNTAKLENWAVFKNINGKKI